MKLKKRSDGDTGEAELPSEKPKSRKSKQNAVIVYIVLLFTAVFLLILLSYFMHSRESENTISSLYESQSEFRREAEAEISRLKEENEVLQREVDELTRQLNAQANRQP